MVLQMIGAPLCYKMNGPKLPIPPPPYRRGECVGRRSVATGESWELAGELRSLDGKKVYCTYEFPRRFKISDPHTNDSNGRWAPGW